MNTAILLNTDAKFLAPTMVAVESFLRAHPKYRESRVFVTCFESNRTIESSLSRFKNLGVSLLKVPDEIIPEEAVVPQIYSRENYIRLFAAEFLPKDIDVFLYFDSDFFFPAALDHLDRQLGSCEFISAVPDPDPGMGHLRELPLKAGAPYFNSGFMIANLAAWRRHDVAGQARSCIRKYREKLKTVDQDVINILFADKIQALPSSYNFQSNTFYHYYWYFWMRRRRMAKAALHFSGGYKPWLRKAHHPYASFYRAQDMVRELNFVEPFSFFEQMKRWRNTGVAIRNSFGRIPPESLLRDVWG